jgi:hypothetical protein
MRSSVFVMSEQGKEAVVALHGKGDFFGEGRFGWRLSRRRLPGRSFSRALLDSQKHALHAAALKP